MIIYFVRHGDTYSTEHGLIQGSSNGDKNILSDKGRIKVLSETCPEMLKIIESEKPDELFIYSGTQKRIEQTARPIIQSLIEKKLLSSDKKHIVFDARLNGRCYGSLEGMNEQELRQRKNFIFKPSKTWSYLFAQAGLSNIAKIEKKTHYEQKVFDFIYELMLNHSENKVAIIFGNSDFFRSMQKCDDIARLCYFGDEYFDEKDATSIVKSKMKIKPGEIKKVILKKPEYIKSEGRYLIIAEQQLIHMANSNYEMQL